MTLQEDYEDALATLSAEHATKIEALKQAAQICFHLEEVGIKVHSREVCIRYAAIDVNREDLPRIRQAIGRLKIKDKRANSWHDDTVDITLTPSCFPLVRLEYQQLTKAGDKCQVVKEPTVERRLVCSV